MDKEEIITKTAAMVKEKFQANGAGHDWWHIYRVWQMAKTIARGEELAGKEVDLFAVELGALLHDLGDYKFNNGKDVGVELSSEWLASLAVPETVISEILHIIENLGFKGGHDANKMQSSAGKIIQDADKLDGMGAIGVARCFAFGGSKGLLMHDPENPPKLNMTKEEYMKSNGTSINHFYEKLLRLKEMMNTETARKLAQHRHEYLEEFLAEFYAEWEGEK